MYNGQFRYHRYKWINEKPKNLKTDQFCFQGFSTTDLEGKELYYSEMVPETGGTNRYRSVIFRKRIRNGIQAKDIFVFDDGKSNYSHPFIALNGSLFFFVSDKPGGAGGMDIYYCVKNSNKWTEPINAGQSINTEKNELFPFYPGQGYLIFSSEGRPGFGGYDLYASVFKNNEWRKSVNLGFPLNSQNNDLVLKWDRLKKDFYLTSDRANGKGYLDIYKVHRFGSEDIKRLFEY